MMFQISPDGIISKAFEQDFVLGLLVALIIVILWFLNKEQKESKKTIEELFNKLEEKNKEITQLQSNHNEKMLGIQKDMIVAMNNQNTVIKGVEVLLQSIKQDVEKLKS